MASVSVMSVSRWKLPSLTSEASVVHFVASMGVSSSNALVLCHPHMHSALASYTQAMQICTASATGSSMSSFPVSMGTQSNWLSLIALGLGLCHLRTTPQVKLSMATECGLIRINHSC